MNKKVSAIIAIILTLAVFGPQGYEVAKKSGFWNQNQMRAKVQMTTRERLNAYPNTPVSKAYKVYADTADTTDDPKDFPTNSFDWFICNDDATATDNLLIKINATTNDAISVRGGQCLSVNTIETGIVYVSIGAGGAPLYQIVAFLR